jgi:hypothetical protein
MAMTRTHPPFANISMAKLGIGTSARKVDTTGTDPSARPAGSA